ncbi:hypothetical protein ACFPOI_29575 [Nonomuraea angiospora]|uniref:Integrase SAM-like N-terminal domain-containing protein n=1 Tax=Nonomuraea angiospora TaxID=46172 RepID=A0ABR9LU82_9ACTN|nr:hypothetical protein [Nonomuraea angiospora]MBE1584223.1 hypothetical protein [Nonomuraea angiospora]
MIEGDDSERDLAALLVPRVQAIGRPATMRRSYAHNLLRWFRFVRAIDMPWNEATRTEARDLSRWIQITDKTDRQMDHFRRRVVGRWSQR